MIIQMKKVKWTGLDQRVVVTFVQVVPEGMTANVDPFTITATPSGISFKGSMLGEMTSQNDLQDFAKLFSEVWKERLKLRPQIVTTPSGH